MKYRDQATISQVNRHQNKPGVNEPRLITEREKKRMRKRWLANIRMIIPDVIWWDSLTDDEQTEVAHEFNYYKNNFKELKQKFPGSIAYIRETKLEKLFK